MNVKLRTSTHRFLQVLREFIEKEVSPGLLHNKFLQIPYFCNIMLRSFSLLILLSICGLSRELKALNPPELRCISVSTTGEVTLEWIIPPDPAMMFKSYHIYYSTSSTGPFIEVGLVNSYTQTSFTHTSAGVTATAPFYYIQTEDITSTFSSSSDTLRAIVLSVTPVGSGIADLLWNAPHFPALPSAASSYSIFREYPAGTWTLIGTASGTTYRDTIDVCDPAGALVPINYKVELDDNKPCTSVSTVAGDNFEDLQPPKVPVFDSVSVDPVSGLAVLGWQASPSPDTYGYKIFRDLSSTGSFPEVGTVAGISTTTFTYTSSSASTQVEYYKIAAIDGCGNQSIISVQPQNTIYATVSSDPCIGKNDLAWNNYNNMISGVAAYNILVSVNGGPLTVIGTETGNSFTHTGLTTGNTYCYIVRAVNNTGNISSSSNKACVTVSLPVPPTYSYLQTATVINDNSIEIKGFTDSNADADHYKVLRGLDPVNFSEAGTVTSSPFGALSFFDNSASPGDNPYYYKIIAIDACGNEMNTGTQTAKTIHLTAASGGFASNRLTWNDYEGWNNIDSYNIYRAVDGVFDPAPIAAIPFTGGINIYTDDVSSIPAKEKYSYYVEANEGPGNPFGGAEKSLSNIADVLLQPNVYIPNAFAPSGINKVFKPVSGFIERSSYSFMIFNRWGEKVFETNDSAEGWDGTFSGKEMPGGLYVYLLKYKIPNGEQFELRGSVTLIR